METKKDIKLLNKGFFLLWQGQLVSTLGDAAYNIALGFWVLQKTGSTALMGTLMAVSALCGVLISPFAGVWIERLNRKAILISMDMLRGISMIIISIAAYNNRLSVWMLFLAAILLSICGALFRPGVNATIPDLIPTDKLTNANSLLSIASTGSNMLGSIAGGYLFQVLGANLLFFFNGLSYFFSGGSLGFVNIPKLKRKIKLSFFEDMKEGFYFMWNDKGLRYLLTVTAFMNFFAYIAIVLFLPLFQKTPYLGASKYGIAMACFMGGGMLGYLFSSIFTISSKNRLLIFMLSNMISNLSIAIAVNQHTFIFMLTLLVLGGLFNGLMNVILLSTVQAKSPTDMRGKIMAFLSMITQGLTPFAMALGGILASFISIKLIISVCFTLIFVLVTPFIFVKPFVHYMSYSSENSILNK